MELQEFKETYLPLGGRFYKTAYAILGSPDDAKDAVQDLYVRLWSLRNDIETIRNPESFGFVLLRGICIDRIRTRHIGEPVRTEITAGYDSQPENGIITRESLDRVMILIDELPERQRMIMRYRILDGLEYDEISRITGLNEGNLRTLLSLARARLRKLMKKEDLL